MILLMQKWPKPYKKFYQKEHEYVRSGGLGVLWCYVSLTVLKIPFPFVRNTQHYWKTSAFHINACICVISSTTGSTCKLCKIILLSVLWQMLHPASLSIGVTFVRQWTNKSLATTSFLKIYLRYRSKYTVAKNMISCWRVWDCCDYCTWKTTVNHSEPQTNSSTYWTTALRVSHANLQVGPKIDPPSWRFVCADGRIYL